ncbi:synaptic vesicle glycoprotein 2A-like [Leguminivora glycinivorella]|uniref:synaptic vesicle glycoprotein 2A-like n=1 Tax=Leguminivora glycinivorella TaxID=1035111 RepID=UPI002010853A|nr:synaptic vesicle glycoprotein 2A-like [Leguminivora glycinivorella]
MSQNTSNNMSNLACVNNKTEVSMEKEEYVVFEDALVLTGFGKYNYRVLILSVYSLIAAIAEVFSGGIIVAASQCDLALGVFEKGIIGSVPVLGVIISAHFWGYLADTRGRLYTLHITILGTAAFAFLCSFANHWIFLTITKFISAIFGCGTYAVIYTLLGESTLQTHRARFLLYATTGIMVAQAVICGIAYPTLLLRFSYYVPYLNIFFRPWRLFNQIIAFLSLLNYILFKCYILESPKFYFSKGEHDKGLEVLKKIFAVNNGRNMDEFNVKRIVLNEDENKTKSSNFFQSVWNQTIPLFHRKYIKKTVLIFAVSVPCYCIGPPFSVWMPLVFNTYKTLGTSDMRFCDIFQVQDVQTNPENNTFTDMSPVCDDTIVPFTFIAISSYALIMTAISIIAVIIVKYFGKKFMYIGIHLLGSTLAFIINVVPIDWSIGAFLGMMCNVVCMGVCTSYAVELFPTYMRAMAVGLSMMFARAVSFIFFNIIGVQLLNNCTNFLIFLGVFLLAGAALGLFLPSDRKPAAKEPDSDL